MGTLTPLFLGVYALEPETKRLVIWLVLIHNVFNAAAFPFSGALSNGLRAAGDVKFTMVVSVISTLAVRLFLSWLLGIVFDMGVIGIAIAMVCDWVFRAMIFFLRLKSGMWKKLHRRREETHLEILRRNLLTIMTMYCSEKTGTTII